MPSPRACRACGKVLLPDLRWCPVCYEPITEFAARAPLHRGDFVGSPIPTGGHIPHWSRWEKSATTFGLIGRVVATMLLLVTLLPAITSGGFMYLIAFPIAAAVVLNAVWAKGWVVPDEPDLPPLPASEVGQPPLTRGEQIGRIIPVDARARSDPRVRLRAGPGEGDRAGSGRDRLAVVVLPGVPGPLSRVRRLRRSHRTDVRASGSRGSPRTAARDRSPARTPA
jgi:hypothetical protein